MSTGALWRVHMHVRGKVPCCAVASVEQTPWHEATGRGAGAVWYRGVGRITGERPGQMCK